MRALFRKELQENLKPAVLGCLLLTVMLLVQYRNCTVVPGSQPLLARSLLTVTSLFCALIGGLFGWLQMRRESHRDLWAFLIHRPVPAPNILLAEILAGLTLYALAAGLPLVALVVWVWVPGHVAAPFEWPMVLPVVADGL